MTPLRLFVNGIVGGFFLFAWSNLAPLNLGDPPGAVELAHEEQVLAALKEHVPEAGLYSFPGSWRERSALEQRLARMRSGPTGLLVVHPRGLDPYAFSRYLVAYLAAVATVLLAGWFLWLASPRIRTLAWRVVFVASLGLFASLVGNLPLWNRGGFPGLWLLGQTAENVFGFTLVGLFLAWRMKTYRFVPSQFQRPR